MANYTDPTRRHGKTEVMLQSIEFACARNKSVIVATSNQQETIWTLRERFPGFLFSTVGDWGIKLHRRRRAGS